MERLKKLNKGIGRTKGARQLVTGYKGKGLGNGNEKGKKREKGG
jgi:hypothetical protein